MDPSLASQAPTLDVEILIAQLQAIVADPKGATVALAIDDTKRQQLKQLARAASFALEEPFETVQRLVYSVSLTTLLAAIVVRKRAAGFVTLHVSYSVRSDTTFSLHPVSLFL